MEASASTAIVGKKRADCISMVIFTVLLGKGKKMSDTKFPFISALEKTIQKYIEDNNLVEVVRCKDCEECEERHTANYLPFLYCKLNEHSVSHNAFCCWGKRRKDG